MIRPFLPFISLLFTVSSPAIDWPTYGGPDRNHRTQENSLRTDWSFNEPEILWQHEVGLGYSSVIEAGGLAYTQGYKNNENTLYCVKARGGD